MIGVDGQLMTVVIGAGGDDVHAVDAVHVERFIEYGSECRAFR